MEPEERRQYWATVAGETVAAAWQHLAAGEVVQLELLRVAVEAPQGTFQGRSWGFRLEGGPGGRGWLAFRNDLVEALGNRAGVWADTALDALDSLIGQLWPGVRIGVEAPPQALEVNAALGWDCVVGGRRGRMFVMLPEPLLEADPPDEQVRSEAASPSAGRGVPPFPRLSAEGASNPVGMELLWDVPLEVSVELGRVEQSLRDLAVLAPGAVLELDRLAGEPVDILVNGQVLARGEVIVIDENFGVRITEIMSPNDRLRRLV